MTLRELRAKCQALGFGAWRMHASKQDLEQALRAHARGNVSYRLTAGKMKGETVTILRKRVVLSPISDESEHGTLVETGDGFRVFYHTETDSMRIVGKVDTQVAAQKGWVYDPAGFFVEHKLDSVKLKRHRSTRRLMEVLYRSQRQVVQEARNESFLGWFRREVGKLEPWRNRDGSLSEEYLTAVPWYFRGKQGGATPVDLAAVYAHEAGWIPDGYPDTFLCALEDAVREAGVTLVREDFTDQAVLLTSAMESVDIDSNGSDTVRTDKGDGLDPLPF